MSRHAAVLFDFSATLFDPTRVVDGSALAERASRRGIALDEELADVLSAQILAHAKSPRGLSLRRGCDVSAARHRDAWVQLAAEVPGVSTGTAWGFYDCIVDPDRWRPYPDAGPVLARLRELDVRVAVVSNCGWDIRSAFAGHLLHGLVDAFVLSCETGVEKPDPMMFEEACRQVDVPPSAALMVGDDPRTDAGAVNALIPVYLLAPPDPTAANRGLSQVLGLVPGQP